MSCWVGRTGSPSCNLWPAIVLPLDFVGPIGRAHFSLGNVLPVPGFKGGTPRFLGGGVGVLASAAYSVLPKPDGLDFSVVFSDNNVRLGGVRGGALRLVKPADTGPLQTRVLHGSQNAREEKALYLK